jgi:hypothetical protein
VTFTDHGESSKSLDHRGNGNTRLDLIRDLDGLAGVGNGVLRLSVGSSVGNAVSDLEVGYVRADGDDMAFSLASESVRVGRGLVESGAEVLLRG